MESFPPTYTGFIGQSGDGKSSLLNNICSSCGISDAIFHSSDNESTTAIESCTIMINGKPVVLIDTPGLNTNRDTLWLNMITKDWPNHSRHLHRFVLVFNGTNLRILESLQSFLSLYLNLCKDLFEHCLVVFKFISIKNKPKKEKSCLNFLRMLWQKFDKKFDSAETAVFYVDSEDPDEGELNRLKDLLVHPKQPIRMETKRLLSNADRDELSHLVQDVRWYVNYAGSKSESLKGDIKKTCEEWDRNDVDRFRALETKYYDFLTEGVRTRLVFEICDRLASFFVKRLEKRFICVDQRNISKYLYNNLKELQLFECNHAQKIAGSTTAVLDLGSSIAAIVEDATAGTAAGAAADTTTIDAVVRAARTITGKEVAAVRRVLVNSITMGDILAMVLVSVAVTAAGLYITQGWNRRDSIEFFSDQTAKHLHRLKYEEELILVVEEAWCDYLCKINV